MDDKNSMLYWYPKVKDLPIPQPKTIFIKVDPKFAFACIDGEKSYDFEKLKEIANKIDYPLFLRTDQMSGKHDWENTCFVKNEENLPINILGVVDATLGCDAIGRPVNAFFFREYIPMDSKYIAFWGKMPVNPERRYFVEDGKVLCHHPYWIKEAIVKPDVKDWELLSEEMNVETEEEVRLLINYAKIVAKEFKEFWSIDFCKAKDGRWILIDMAIGENSWHPKDCSNNRTKEIDYLQFFSKKLEDK